MDVLDFIQNGITVNNPEYNSKTKEGRTKPKTIISNDVNHIDSSINKVNQNMVDDLISLSDLGSSEKYSKYGVTVNPINTEEELNKERARNQSWTEQLGRMIGQGIVNEIALASFRGIFDIADGIYNEFFNKSDNDYTNPISQKIEEAQESIRNAWEIYQVNPEESFNLNDFGWYAQNAVSIFSSIGLMIPATGYAKVLSGIGKVTRLNRLSTKAAEAVLKSSKAYKEAKSIIDTDKKLAALNRVISSKANLAGKYINEATYVANQGLMSRIGENYQEARETHKDSYNTVINKLNNMSDDEKNKWKSQMGYETLSDEEIANKLAGESADLVFNRDMKLLLLDILQFASLSKGLKGTAFAGRKNKLYTQNYKALSELNGLSKNTIDEIAETSSAKLYLKNALKHFGNTIERSQITEGFEEGYQGINQDLAKQYTEFAFNPSLSFKTLNSYLTDGHIWEQAVWGWLGGLAMQGVYKGSEAAKDLIESKNNKKLSETDAARLRSSEEDILAEDLKKRIQLTNEFQANMQLLQQGYNPIAKKINAETGKWEDIDIDNLNEQEKEKLRIDNDEDKQLIYQKLINDYATEMILNSADRGTGDLLMDWINNDAFKEAIKSVDNNNTLYDYIAKQMNNTLSMYYGEIYKVENNASKEITSPFIARLIARDQLRAFNAIEDSTKSIETIDDLISKEDNDSLNEFNYEMSELAKRVQQEKINILQTKERIRQLYENHKISKSEYNNKIYSLNNRLNALMEEFATFSVDNNKHNHQFKFYDDLKSFKDNYKNIEDIISNEDNLNEFLKVFDNWYSDNISGYTHSLPGENTRKLVKEKIDEIINRNFSRSQILKNQKDYDNTIKDYQYAISKDAEIRKSRAYDTLQNYIKTSNNPQDTLNEILEEDNLPANVKEASKIAQLTTNQQEYIARLEELVRNREAELVTTIPSPTATTTTTTTTTSTQNTNSTNNATATASPTQTQQSSTGSQQLSEEEQLIVDGEEANRLINELNAENPGTDLTEIYHNDSDIIAFTSNVAYNTNVKFHELITSHNGKKILHDIITNPDGWNIGKGKEFIDSIVQEVQKRFNETYNEEFIKKEIIPIIVDTLTQYDKLNTISSDLEKEYIESLNNLSTSEVRSASTTKIEMDGYKEKVEKLINSIINLSNEEKKDIGITKDENGRYIIDTDAIFNYLLEKEDFNTCIRLYNLLRSYIADNSLISLNNSVTSNYIFDNLNKFNKFNRLNNPEAYFNYLQQSNEIEEPNDRLVHSKVPTKVAEALKEFKKLNNQDTPLLIYTRGHYVLSNELKTKLSPEHQSILQNYINALHRAKNGGYVTYSINGNGISIQCRQDPNVDNQDDELAFIAQVKSINKTNTGFGQIRNESVNKIYFDVTKNLDNSITSGVDKLFKEIHDGLLGKSTNRIVNEICKQIRLLNNTGNINLTSKELAADIISYLSQYNDVVRGKNSKDGDFIYDILNQIKDIVYYNKKYDKKSNFEISYQQYLKRLFDNYSDTFSIQDKLKNNEIVTGRLNDSELERIDTVEEYTVEYQDAYQQFGTTENPKLVYIGADGQIYTENEKGTKPNITSKGNHNMGIEVVHNNGRPGIIWFNKGNKIDGDLKEDVTEELNNIFKEYFDSNDLSRFDILYNKLKQLIGAGSLFYNVRLRLSSDKNVLFLTTIDGNTPLISIYRKDRNNPDKSGGIVNLTGKKGIILDSKDKRISNLSETIVDNLIYNRLAEGVLGEKSTKEKNPYFTKNNNGFTVKINGKEYKYKSYLDFVLENKAFQANQVKRQNNFMSAITDNNGYSYFTIESVKQPVESNQDKRKTAGQVLKQATQTKPIDIVDLLKAANIPTEVINLLTTPIMDNEEQVSLLSREVYYDSRKKVDGVPVDDFFKYIKHTNGKTKQVSHKIVATYLGAQLIDKYDNEHNGSEELLRLLIHENIHKYFNTRNEAEKEYIKYQLLDIYNQFISALEEDKINGNEDFDIEELENWLNTTLFSKTYIDALDKLDHNSQEYKDKLQESLDEFLAEVLSQGVLIEYLDSKKYTGTNTISDEYIDENKSLWQKIIDVLYRLFTGKTLYDKNKNTIFSQLYKSLSVTQDYIRNFDSTKHESTNQETNSTVEDEDFGDEGYSDDIDNDEYEGYDDIYETRDAKTSTIQNYTNEEKEILKNAKRDENDNLLAPNGKPTNLTDKQYAQVRTKAFINWFGDWINNPENASKVIDENGEPLVVYHGSNKKFDTFIGNKEDNVLNPLKDINVNFFTNDKNVANTYIDEKKETPSMYELYLNIRNPYTINFDGRSWRNLEEGYKVMYVRSSEEISKIVKTKEEAEKILQDYLNNNPDISEEEKQYYKVVEGFGNRVGPDTNQLAKSLSKQSKYDGIIVKNVIDVGGKKMYFDENGKLIPAPRIIADDYIVVPNNGNIKSATDNNGNFSTTDNNIRHAKTKMLQTRQDLLRPNITNGSATVVDDIKFIPDMNSYIKGFSFDMQLKIAKMIENGDISFLC